MPLPTMILVDTSALMALVDKKDQFHLRASGTLEHLLAAGELLCLHNYLIVEAVALITRKVGAAAARELLVGLDKFKVVWVSEQLHRAGLNLWFKNGSRQLSFVDSISFVVMLKEKIDTAFTFDKHFEQAGFKIYK